MPLESSTRLGCCGLKAGKLRNRNLLPVGRLGVCAREWRNAAAIASIAVRRIRFIAHLPGRRNFALLGRRADRRLRRNSR